MARLRLVGRPEVGFGRGSRGTMSQNAPRQARAPEPNPLRQHGALFGGEIRRAIDGRADRVVDRAQESGDVARRWRLVPALLEALPRLAFEVENVGVILGDQDLAEMEIAVMADLAAVEACALRPSMCAKIASRWSSRRCARHGGGFGRGGLRCSAACRTRGWRVPRWPRSIARCRRRRSAPARSRRHR